MSKLQNIIYISGSGRSGSTLLERIIHSSKNATALGEFHCLWRLHESEITCSCGAPFSGDPHWQTILKLAGIDNAAIAELQRLEQTICRTSFIAVHRFDIDAISQNPDVKRFNDLQFGIFEAIADTLDTPIVVDSSKAGPRAWLLACNPKVRIIHLYRDPADVILSWRSAKYDPGMRREMKRMSISGAASDWWKVEYLMSRLGRTTHVTRIDYGELCNDPSTILGSALSNLSLETIPLPAWIDSTSLHPKDQYHSLNGNPDRFKKGPICISKRQADWSETDHQERLVIKAISTLLRSILPSRPTSQI